MPRLLKAEAPGNAIAKRKRHFGRGTPAEMTYHLLLDHAPPAVNQPTECGTQINFSGTSLPYPFKLELESLKL